MASQLRETRVNYWVFEFYISKAFEAFRNEEYDSYVQFRNLVQALVFRPVNNQSDVIIKLRFMQFLSQINDGDKPDITFQSSLTPLESALTTLENICSEIDVSQSVLEQVHTSIREMLVIVCIKNEKFEKARLMLYKHFPKGRDSAGKKKLFEDLIKRKCSTHSVIKSVSYSEFKQDMLDFIDNLYHLPEPFLIKVSKLAEQGQTIDGGVSRKSQNVRAPDEQSSTTGRGPQMAQLPSEQRVSADHCPFSSEQNGQAENGHSSAGPLSSTVLVQLSLSMLRAVFLDLAELLPVSAPFSLVQEEVDREAVEQESGIDLDSDELILRLSETPVDLLLRETEESRRAGGERVLDADQPEQQGQENPVDLTLTENVLEKSGCYNGSGLTPHQIRGAASADPENANTNQNAKKHPGAAGSVTVAQLVMEEDSQTSEFETVDSQLTPSPLTAGHSEDDLLNSLPTNSMPVRKNRRPASSRKSIPSEPEPASPEQPTEPQNCSTPTRVASPSPSSSDSTPVKHHNQIKKRNWLDVSGIPDDWSDEESLFGASTSVKADTKGTKRKKWTEEESDWVCQGVAKYGEGRWGKIKNMFPFQGRTAVNIKDRWRTMKKLNLA
uniref:Telomeric repeat binding factor a n=3 Tax=Astyanax mexicanus TaxID=7994 RepID=A0A3B1JNP6_ASTMX